MAIVLPRGSPFQFSGMNGVSSYEDVFSMSFEPSSELKSASCPFPDMSLHENLPTSQLQKNKIILSRDVYKTVIR